MNVLDTSKSSDIIPATIKISDMTRMFDVDENDQSAENCWRWSLLEMVADILKLVQLDSKTPIDTIWKDEARLRAAGMLQLALIDSFTAANSRRLCTHYKWDHRAAARLVIAYRRLQEGKRRGPFACENLLRDTLLCLAATYQPVMHQFKIQTAVRPTILDWGQRRALVLLINALAQSIFQHANKTGQGGLILLSSHAPESKTVSLTFQTSMPLSVIYTTPGYEIASRLATNLQAEFVSRQNTGRGSHFELRFSPFGV